MIFLALGSNLNSSFGDRFKNINLAISYLEAYGVKILKKSSFYETPSYPNKNNPKFINVVINIDTNLSIENLISSIFDIEKKLERQRFKKNDPRTCDIDVIDFKGRNLNFEYKDLNFTIPHKKLIYRNFVLFPLSEISPNWKHPKSDKFIKDLIENLSSEDKMSILKLENS